MIFGMDPMPFMLIGIICMIGAVLWLGYRVNSKLDRIIKHTKGTKDEIVKQNSGSLPAIPRASITVQHPETGAGSSSLLPTDRAV